MLKRVSIQNFKSLKDVTLDLQKVNLLIGPNNSGKTNFLKALEFFDLYANEKASINNSILFHKNPSNRMSIKVSFEEIFGDDKKYYVHYLLSSFVTPSEILFNKSNSQVWVFNSQKIDSEEENKTTVSKSSTAQALDVRLGPLKVYKPDPNKLIQPGPVGTKEELVNADASNLVGFLDLMLGKYRRNVFSRTEADLHKCIPEFDEINLDDASPTDEIKKLFGDKSFKRIGLANSKQGVTYWADELSEGTLYFLALLCIINQPNPPKLLLLEEPEKGIHPRRIREVMDFIRRLVAEKDIQVIMTTHSPLLLDEFAESPESVFVFDKDAEGATIVNNLQRDVIEPANQKNAELGIPPVHFTDALGEYWTIGFLGGVPHETA
ncbi:AAA family ATPase [Spirosoma sp.]|uniref:AAA family ATPase n=1 Tax=Spirosoma sp. TaxID=1899569 RepID=UPI00260F41F0|nr:AAA family ATPase [Spirosoma sp.]MCX6213289.1 AAA family ATPase [Spirosoma sp.]